MTPPRNREGAEGCYTTTRSATNEELVAADAILAARDTKGQSLTSPAVARSWPIPKTSGVEHEIFGSLFLDTRHRVISFEETFRGTLDGASISVRPRGRKKRY